MVLLFQKKVNMNIDDGTLFLNKFTNYPDNLDLYNLLPILYTEYQKECQENRIEPFDMEEFYSVLLVWFNKDILIKN